MAKGGYVDNRGRGAPKRKQARGYGPVRDASPLDRIALQIRKLNQRGAGLASATITVALVIPTPAGVFLQL
jgi:hypothetical protein